MQSCNHHHWRILIPDDWLCEDEDGTRLIYHPKGAGTLEITSSKQPTPIGDDDLRYFASEQIEQGVEPAYVKLGDFSGIELIYEHDDLYWRDWLLRNDELLLLATYTCPPGREEKEEGMLDVMMATLKRR